MSESIYAELRASAHKITEKSLSLANSICRQTPTAGPPEPVIFPTAPRTSSPATPETHYTPQSNIVYTYGVDYTGDSSMGYVSNGSSATVTITMDEILRAAESIPPSNRGTSLRIPVRNAVAGSFYASNTFPSIMDVQYTTVNIPWTQVYEYQNQASGFGLGQGSLLGQAQQSQTAAAYQAMQQQYVYGIYGNQWLTNAWGSTPPETAAERAAREERHVKEMAKRKAAETRAEQLLFTILKPEQVRQYQDKGYFETEVDDRIYRIKKGRAQNIEQIVNGKAVLRLCAHPREMVPDADNVLAQYLMLKSDEEKFLKTANHTRLY